MIYLDFIKYLQGLFFLMIFYLNSIFYYQNDTQFCYSFLLFIKTLGFHLSHH